MRDAMKIRYLIIAALMFAAYGWVGSMERADAEREAEHYAEMVCAGAWPDYDNRNPDCTEVAK
jgi:hypothetical protein